MKKIGLFLVIVSVMSAVLAGCSSEPKAEEGAAPAAGTEEKK